jgi:hypothetical protein
LEEIVLEQYHEFLSLLKKVLVDCLPIHWLGIDHKVQLTAGETPNWDPLYSMSWAELEVVKEWLEENMSQSCICQSWSPFRAFVVLVKTPDWGVRFCITCHDIHSTTIQNHYPLPIIWEILNLLRVA